MKPSKFSTSHSIDTRDIPLYITLEWNYYPGMMATYHDPEEPEHLEFIRVVLPDYLESRQEEVKWLVEDDFERLQDEAMKQIHNIFERWRTGNES